MAYSNISLFHIFNAWIINELLNQQERDPSDVYITFLTALTSRAKEWEQDIQFTVQ